MARLHISEVFGHDVNDHSPEGKRDRQRMWCPFRDSKCTKGGKQRPLGICSFGDEQAATSVCPVRFLQGNRIITDAGRIAFGDGKKIVALPEMRLLRVPDTGKRIGKIDFLIALLDSNGQPSDFAALEVQAVYISGKSVRPFFNEFLRTEILPEGGKARPDYRSSAQKRLMPQLSLKVPVFRRWGKRFFVVVDKPFFDALPRIRRVEGKENSEITWLVYALNRNASGVGYSLSDPAVIFTLWDDVLVALREGEAPQQSEVLAEISTRLPQLKIFDT
jgi:Restriction endonuclease NotI.